VSEPPAVAGTPPAVAGTPPAAPEQGPVPGPDGQLRCPWGLSAPEYIAYHDEEWGRPVRGDTAIFERLCLEGFQSGLSWLTILRKRENFRAAFAGFDASAVADFGEADVARLLADAGIVRNRAKINAVISNARAALDLPDGLTALVWKYASEQNPPPRTLAEVPPSTPASKALSAELKRHGFIFTGPVTAYATMQACGIVNDHLAACFCRTRLKVQVHAAMASPASDDCCTSCAAAAAPSVGDAAPPRELNPAHPSESNNYRGESWLWGVFWGL
jgi:DNA-3-methyladenine glycosylase I